MFCRNCGKELIGSPEFCPGCGAKPMNATTFCHGCGAPTTPLTEICTKCGARVAKVNGGRTWKPTTAGILSIIAGAVGVILGIVLFAVGGAVGGLLGVFGLPGLGGLVAGFAAVPLIVGIVAIVGGIHALGRKRWGLALGGAICALFPPPVIILGILSIIFVILGRKEFK